MPGTTLKELDNTDIDSLLPWYLWKTGAKTPEDSGDVVCRDGKPYRRVTARNAKWLENAF